MEPKEIRKLVRKTRGTDELCVGWLQLFVLFGIDCGKLKRKSPKELCEAYLKKICHECFKKNGTKKKFFNKVLCDECNSLDKYKLVCKSTALKEYYLTDDDLDDLKYVEVKNPHYRSSSNMMLFSLVDIVNKFYYKYDTYDKKSMDEKLIFLKNQKKERSERIKTTKMNKQMNRRYELESALHKNGVKWRNDSKLCKGYVENTLDSDWTIDIIVQRMCEMKYLYEYCNMDKYYDKAYESQREELEAGYFPDCSVFELAEMMALEKYGGYPIVFPWLNE